MSERLRTASGLRLGGRLLLATAMALGTAAAAPSVWAQAAGQTAGRSDADIQSDVAYAISHSQALKGQPITAATVEGDVTLSGNVKDTASKELAESLIYRVNGVRSVANHLTVGPDALQQDAAPATADNGGQASPQDPNYDPAQQNMAQAGPQAGAGDQTAPQAGAPQEADQQPDMTQQRPPSQNYPQPGYAPPPQQTASGPVTVPAGTLLQVRTSEPLDATRLQPGAFFQATAATDVYENGVLAVPRGAVIQGKVVDAKTNNGALAGKQGLALQLTSLNLGGQSYSLASDVWSGQGPGKGAYSASNAIGGAAIGAVIGAIAGRGTGAAIGAGVGGAVGATASAATTGPRMALPPEAVLNFHLTAAVTVTPVSPQEAQRLAASLPELHPRYPGYPASGYPGSGYPGYGYAYGYPPPPPPPPGYYYGYRYGYPYPVYYRPGYYYRYRY